VSTVQTFLEKTRAAPFERNDTEARLNRIRAAVIEECAQKSYRLASMAAIAKRAKVSTASLYRDFGNREALLEHVATFTAPMIAADFQVDQQAPTPQARLHALLLAQGAIFQNPHANWVYRAHVSGEVSGGKGLIAIGRETRDQIEAFWANEIKRLQSAGLIGSVDVRETVNFVLGSVQRRTLLAMLLFGPGDAGAPTTQIAASSAIEWVLALKDTPHSIPDFDVANETQILPSPIQTRVDADLACQHERTDAVARHQKILAAAITECSEIGFAHANMAGVAKRANVSTATLYEHFHDKDDMFVKAVGYMVPILTEFVTMAPIAANPCERIATMLINHGSSYLDPFMAWLFRLYVSFEGQGSSVAGQLGNASRTLIEQFWSGQLKTLEDQGYLVPSDHAVTVNLLLGGVERRSLVAMLLLGTDYAPHNALVTAAKHGARALFHRYGTEKFFAQYVPTEATRAVA
jgi:AcrR family transcriptional regulator